MALAFPPARPFDGTTLSGFVDRDAEDAVARDLLRAEFPADRERLILAGFDGFGRLMRIECCEGGIDGRCTIAPACWHRLIGRGAATVLMAHNQPSGCAYPSEADLAATGEAIDFLRRIAVDLTDHLIFVDHGHFSFRRAQLL